MSIESLLNSLKSRVSGVSGVQPRNHAVLRRYPMKFDGVSGVSQSADVPVPDTPDTLRDPPGYQRKPASIGACTPDTPDTPQNFKTESEAPKVGAGETAVSGWLLHFPDREPLPVFSCPPSTADEVIARYGATSATPCTIFDVGKNPASR